MPENTFLPQQQGITLVESMLVLAVIALLGLYAAPSFTQWLTRLSAEADLRRAVHVIRFARKHAQHNDSQTFVSVRLGRHWCIAATSRSDCDCLTSQCTLGGRHVLAFAETNTSTLLSNRFSRLRPLQFDGVNGSAFDSAGALTLHYNTLSASVVISPLGRIRSCEPENKLTGVVSC